MKKQEIAKVASAQILGTIAFKNGTPRAAALDKELRGLLEGIEVGGGSIKIMQAWYKGWDLANLNS